MARLDDHGWPASPARPRRLACACSTRRRVCWPTASTAGRCRHATGYRRQQARQSPVAEQVRAERRGERAGVAQEVVEHQGATYVEVQRVLGGEADAGEHLLGVAGHGARAAAGHRLGQGGGERGAVVPCGVGRGVGGFDGDEAVGEAVAHGLEAGDGAIELDAVDRVLAGQGQHRPGHPDELVGQGPLSGGNGVRPGLGGRLPLDRLGAHRRPRAGRGEGRCPRPRAARGLEVSTTTGDPRRSRPAPEAGAGQRGQPDAAHDDRSARRAPRPGPWPGGRRRSSRPASAPSALARTTTQGRGRRRRRALVLEDGGDRRGRIGREGVLPAQLGQRGVEVGTRRRGRGVLDALGEELALLLVHHRSGPRSRRRRATMLRWISALPP